MEISPNKTEKVKLDFKDSKYATGRRKRSIAKIWLKKGSGKIGHMIICFFKAIALLLRNNSWHSVRIFELNSTCYL